MALLPRSEAHEVVLSPVQVDEQYRIDPAVALRVRTKGRSFGSTDSRASWELLPMSSVCIARPQRPTSLRPLAGDRALDVLAGWLRASFQASFAKTYSAHTADQQSPSQRHIDTRQMNEDVASLPLLSFHMQSIPIFRRLLTPCAHHS